MWLADPQETPASACQVNAVVRAFPQWQQDSGAVPKSITIHDVPDEVCEELADRAALTGRSLQEYLRALVVDLAGRPDAEAWVAKVRARKGSTDDAISVERILALRDAGRATFFEQPE